MANYPSNERQLEEIWKEGWHFTIRDQCPFERFEKAEFAAGMDFTIHSGIYSIERYSGTCRSKRGKRVVRYDRERCLVNVPKKFRSSCGASFFYIRRNSPFFSPSLSFPSSPPIFSPEFGGKKYSNPDPNPFHNWKIDVSNRCFRGQKAEKRTERKKQIEGKRFHRRIGRVRNVFVYNIPGRIGVLFTLRGIHSSPVKRVKTQKSESLFVTSFDVAINSFEITACAGRTGPNIRQQPDPVLLSKIQISNKSPPPPQIYVLYSVPRRVSPRYMFG